MQRLWKEGFAKPSPGEGYVDGVPSGGAWKALRDLSAHVLGDKTHSGVDREVTPQKRLRPLCVTKGVMPCSNISRVLHRKEKPRVLSMSTCGQTQI